MRRTISRMTLAVAALTALCACAADASMSEAELSWVDASELTDRSDLYLDPTVSWRPTTLATLGGARGSAIPVEVEVFGQIAVAWARDESGRVTGRTREDVVALFRVLDEVEGATPISDRTSTDGPAPVYTPGGAEPSVTLPPGFDDPNVERSRLVLIRFIDVTRLPPREELELWRELAGAHPGC